MTSSSSSTTSTSSASSTTLPVNRYSDLFKVIDSTLSDLYGVFDELGRHEGKNYDKTLESVTKLAKFAAIHFSAQAPVWKLNTLYDELVPAQWLSTTRLILLNHARIGQELISTVVEKIVSLKAKLQGEEEKKVSESDLALKYAALEGKVEELIRKVRTLEDKINGETSTDSLPPPSYSREPPAKRPNRS